MTRIGLKTTIADALMSVVEGNPGAIVALTEVMSVYKEVDPDSAFGEITPLLDCDSFGIYGSKIHVLFKDICDFNPDQFIMVMRATQLGFLSVSALQAATQYPPKAILDIKSLARKVTKQLPRFKLTSMTLQRGEDDADVGE
jgi:hypothetical protein